MRQILFLILINFLISTFILNLLLSSPQLISMRVNLIKCNNRLVIILQSGLFLEKFLNILILPIKKFNINRHFCFNSLISHSVWHQKPIIHLILFVLFLFEARPQQLFQVVIVRLFFKLQTSAMCHKQPKFLRQPLTQLFHSRICLDFLDHLVLLFLGVDLNPLPR